MSGKQGLLARAGASRGGLALLTHGYREWESLARASNPFCANASLFAVNNLKLAGLLAVAILGAPLVLAMEA